MMRELYEIAKTDLDRAILRELRVLIEYQSSHNVPMDIQELCSEAFDFLLEEYIRKEPLREHGTADSDMLSDEEFDAAFALLRRNRIRLRSVENARTLGGFAADGGRRVRGDLLIRSGNLAHLTEEEADYLKNKLGLTLVIDLRTPSETEAAPDRMIPGVRHENVPLTETLDTTRMEYLTRRYLRSETAGERAWFTEQYARIDEVVRMYRNISTDSRSRDAIAHFSSFDGDGRRRAFPLHQREGQDWHPCRADPVFARMRQGRHPMRL